MFYDSDTVFDNLKGLSAITGLPVIRMKYQRVFGPKPDIELNSPNCEILVTGIPPEIWEIHLISLFSMFGEVYKLRLMMREHSFHHRGYCLVTYTTLEDTQNAVVELNNFQIANGQFIKARLDTENNTLFMGGILKTITRDELFMKLLEYGMAGIKNVVLYSSYFNPKINRGFAFVEFNSHEDAKLAKENFHKKYFFGRKILLDWGSPLPEMDETTKASVRKLFLRNLNISQSRLEFVKVIRNAAGCSGLSRIYKSRDYAFLHFKTREEAVVGMEILKNYYKGTRVEVMWAIPAPLAAVTNKLKDKQITSLKLRWANLIAPHKKQWNIKMVIWKPWAEGEEREKRYQITSKTWKRAKKYQKITGRKDLL